MSNVWVKCCVLCEAKNRFCPFPSHVGASSVICYTLMKVRHPFVTPYFVVMTLDGASISQDP